MIWYKDMICCRSIFVDDEWWWWWWSFGILTSLFGYHFDAFPMNFKALLPLFSKICDSQLDNCMGIRIINSHAIGVMVSVCCCLNLWTFIAGVLDRCFFFFWVVSCCDTWSSWQKSESLPYSPGNYMGVSKNRGGAPKSWTLIGFSIINHPFWGTPIFGNTHISISLLNFSFQDDWNSWNPFPKRYYPPSLEGNSKSILYSNQMFARKGSIQMFIFVSLEVV